jgi:hypothetical protein
MVVLGTIFQLWLMHAVPGCVMAAPIRFLGRKRIGWANWELLALVVPFSVWTLLMLSPLSIGRNSTNLIEPLYLSISMPLVAIIYVSLGGRFSKLVQAASVISVLCGVAVTTFFIVPMLNPDPRRGLTTFDRRTIDAHEQRYMMSCVPSAVEMVLKLLGRVPRSYYRLQTAWKNKADGSFHNFDGKTFEGVTFHHKFFAEPHGSHFPFSALFETIDRELKAGRYVTVGLARGGDVHSWLIYDEAPDGEFLAVSKFGPWTIEQRHVKRAITRMQGTDIGIYEVTPSPFDGGALLP